MSFATNTDILEYNPTDWNKIEELPQNFFKLTTLKSLKMEGNPMRVPTIEIISDGVPEVLKWCRNSHDFDVNRKRKFIVNSLTHVIRVAVENKLPKVDIFNENFEFTEPESKHKDTYYGFVADELFEHIIPAANRIAMEADSNSVFSWSVEEAVDAIEHFKDPYGPVGHTNVKVLFKRCSCKGKNGKRRVCVP